MADEVLNMIRGKGLEIAGTIPEDNMVYEYDLKGRPTVEIPEDNKAVKSAFEIFEKIMS
jgi:CO dehydrogenase maturation factor